MNVLKSNNDKPLDPLNFDAPVDKHALNAAFNVAAIAK
jgi:hypothetical protein